MKQMPDITVSMPDPAVDTEDHEVGRSFPVLLTFEGNSQEKLERDILKSKMATRHWSHSNFNQIHYFLIQITNFIV